MKPMFKTEDGKIFEEAEDATAHEDYLAQLAPANEYKKALEKAGWKKASVTRQVNAVRSFLGWKVTGEVPAMQEAKPKVEKEAEKVPPKDSVKK